MKRKIMALFDTDAVYAVHFAEYAGRRSGIPFEVHAFTDREALEAFVRKEKVELLLVSSAEADGELLAWPVPKIVVLSEEPVRDGEGSGCPRVFKYQSQAEVIREVMAYYGQSAPAADPAVVAKPKMKTVAVMSPVGRCGKTSLALALGRILSMTKPVLYVNLEPFSGLAAAFPAAGEGSLTDLLFCLRQEDGSGAARLSGMTVRFGNLDLLPPAKPGREGLSVSREDWERLWRLVRDESGYEVLIVDGIPEMSDVLAFLASCDVIFMPVRQDPGSQAKTDEFFSWLKEQDAEETARKIRRLRLKETQAAADGHYFQDLPYTVYGGWAKELIRREGL